VAETTAVELGWIDLLDALELAALLATKDPERAERAKGRWLRRYLDADPGAGLRATATVLGWVEALGGPGHAQALALLRIEAQLKRLDGGTVSDGSR
jgi:hypothetical protein